MKLSKLVALVVLLLNISICFGQMHYQNYTNENLHYSLDYPATLFPRGNTYEAKFENPFSLSPNTTLPQEIGIKFSNGDATIIVWGEVVWEPDQINMREFFDYYTKGYEITSQVISDNFYKASGFASDESFFYRHTELLNTILYTLWIDYDLSKKDVYEPVVEMI